MAKSSVISCAGEYELMIMQLVP